MSTIDIDQAKKIIKEIEQDQKTTDFTKIEKLLFEFIELINDKLSEANANLFANIVTHYIQFGGSKSPESYRDSLYWVKIYISIMENPSVYEKRGILTI